MIKLQKGFTLMELMIVVAIIGIIAAVAFPSYTESAAKAKRSSAQGDLMAFVSAIERHYTETSSYEGAAAGGADNGAPDGSIFPSQSPVDNSNKYYNLSISNAAATTYTLTATIIAGGAMDGDRCGNFSITHTGAKSTSTGAANCNW